MLMLCRVGCRSSASAAWRGVVRRARAGWRVGLGVPLAGSITIVPGSGFRRHDD